MEKMTINQALQNTIQQHGPKKALSSKINGEYQSVSYNDLGDCVRDIALGLHQLGIKAGERVALLSENRAEWAFLDLGILALGVVNVPMYSTLTLEQVEYIANDSQAKAIFVSNVKQLEKVRNNETDMPKLEKIVCFDMDKVEMGEEMISFDQV